MGNIIRARADTDLAGAERSGLRLVDPSSGSVVALTMSNGLTSVVVSVLALATSREASSESEEIMAIQLAAADQSVFGFGVVGFALTELRWALDPEEFDAQRRFLVRAVDRARTRSDWGLLDYRPNPASAREALATLREMIGALTFDQLTEPDERGLSVIPPGVGERCDAHGVLLHRFGCVVCNDR